MAILDLEPQQELAVRVQRPRVGRLQIVARSDPPDVGCVALAAAASESFAKNWVESSFTTVAASNKRQLRTEPVLSRSPIALREPVGWTPAARDTIFNKRPSTSLSFRTADMPTGAELLSKR